MTLLEVVVSIALDGMILAGLLGSLVAGVNSAGQSWRLLEGIETVCRVEQLADDAAGRAAAASWTQVDAYPTSLSFSIDEDGNGRIDGRSNESVAFEIKNDRLIHRIGRQRVAIATGPNQMIHYRRAQDRAAPVLAEIPAGGHQLALALPHRRHATP